MLKNVQIIDRSSGQIVAEYPVPVELGDIKEDEAKEFAWENAVEEGLVEDSKKDDFDLEIVSDEPLSGVYDNDEK